MNSIINKIKKFLKNNVLMIFIFFTAFIIVLGFIYNFGLNPTEDKVTKIINKFTANDYSIPYRVAERYLTWFNMRTFFFALNYILTLLALVASLLTVFYASTDADGNADKKRKRNHYIVFLSLLSTCFTVANMFINAGSMANMSQHAWRELDSCIMETINETDLSSNEKDKIITDKLIEIEKYIEIYEH